MALCLHARDSSYKDPDVSAWTIPQRKKETNKKEPTLEEENRLRGHGESQRKCAHKKASTAAVKTASPSSMKNVFSKEII